MLPADLASRSAMSDSGWTALASRETFMPWADLRREFIDAVTRGFEGWISAGQAHFRDQLVVATGRFDQGARLMLDLLEEPHRPMCVLDVGAGNAGVAFAFANDRHHTVYTLDLVPNVQALALRRRLPVPIHPAVGDGAALPFASGSIDVVLLVDVLEHLSAPSAVAAEIMRVLRPGGRCIVSTPARVPLLLRPDPHYGIRGLLLFPNEWQRFLVNRLFRRRITTPSGAEHPAYDVEHTFWHVKEIAALFPGPRTVDVVYDAFYAPPGGFAWWMLRRPRVAIEELRYRLRWFAYGHMVIHKGAASPRAPVHDRIAME